MSYITVEDTFQFLEMLPRGNLVEFGVFSGNTLNRLIKGAEASYNPFEKVYGFDSFTGLPKEAPFVWQNPEWPEGAFNVCKDFGLNSVEEAITFVRSRVERKDIELIPGFFKVSLTEEIGKELFNSASYIHCDTDIYSSSFECMNFVWSNCILKVGGIIRYDDWISTPSNAGQQLAHKELEDAYKLQFNRLADNVFQYMGPR